MELVAVADDFSRRQPGSTRARDVCRPKPPCSRPAPCGDSTRCLKYRCLRAAKDFFDNLESRADAAKLAGMTLVPLRHRGRGQWLVTVADGNLTVAEGGGEADATITATGETFEKIVAGEQTRRPPT